jgi:hypothetical protein
MAVHTCSQRQRRNHGPAEPMVITFREDDSKAAEANTALARLGNT